MKDYDLHFLNRLIQLPMVPFVLPPSVSYPQIQLPFLEKVLHLNVFVAHYSTAHQELVEQFKERIHILDLPTAFLGQFIPHSTRVTLPTIFHSLLIS